MEIMKSFRVSKHIHTHIYMQTHARGMKKLFEFYLSLSYLRLTLVWESFGKKVYDVIEKIHVRAYVLQGNERDTE